MISARWLIVILLPLGRCQEVHTELFEKMASFTNRTPVSYNADQWTSAVSPIACARDCTARDDCVVFYYGETSHDCVAFPSSGSVSIASTQPAAEPTEFFMKDVSVAECPLATQGFYFDNSSGTCFKFSDTDLKTWVDAVDACEADGLEFIKLDTPAKLNGVMAVINQEFPNIGTTAPYILIGGSRPLEWWGNSSMPDVYYWLDGSQVEWYPGEPYWASGQPNGLGFEECLGMPTTGSQLLYDRTCTTAYPYICGPVN